jgi:glucose-6-phosphate 1-epimerase
MGAVIPADVPVRQLIGPDGARVQVALDGAQLLSWIPAGETTNRFFLSARSRYGAGQSARGGVPICFPQFGSFGDLPQHGFARRMRWREVGSGQLPGIARFHLTPADLDDATRAAWPHAFHANLLVVVVGNTLALTLGVANVGETPFSFTAALHPYFAVTEAIGARVEGLGGLRLRDALQDGAIREAPPGDLTISGPLDQIYYDAPSRVTLHDGAHTIALDTKGFTDAVVWNPGAAGTNSREDFVPGEESQMLCVEAGIIGQPVTLPPQQGWQGTLQMTAVA